jgi:3-deoxy-manno-octulosonate cytidylyltransferase (CMP-KDO synthetase)
MWGNRQRSRCSLFALRDSLFNQLPSERRSQNNVSSRPRTSVRAEVPAVSYCGSESSFASKADSRLFSVFRFTNHEPRSRPVLYFFPTRIETSRVKAIAIIPARLASTRLPRKLLREIAGRPMLARVYEAARACSQLSHVIVATDSTEIVALCEQNGWEFRMTSPEHRSGTDRVHEVAQAIDADVYVNVQGDEPLARREHLEALLALMERGDVQVGTLKTLCSVADIGNPNAVKVVAALDDRALYFSRATIPFDRDDIGTVPYYKHLGFYAYRKAALDSFCSWPESRLERTERLEQLRFLANGVAIHVAETPYDTVGVDTEEDLRRVEEILARNE